MQKVEIRVRPVIRHVVTRYTASEPLPPIAGAERRTSASLETLGEFDNELQAEQVAAALSATLPKTMQYVAVERTFDALTNALYFDYEEDATQFVARALQQGREFRVFSRVVTDPIALAHRNAMPSHPHPQGDRTEVPELPRAARCCGHDSDCAVHNMPAMPNGPCDCRAPA
jgi:hypothetical protein